MIPVPANTVVPGSGSAGVAQLRFATEEFFWARIRNPHTRTAYRHAVGRFLAWAQASELALGAISPAAVAGYLDGLQAAGLSIATRKQHLAALRQFFDALVVRHVIALNPAASVRGERYQQVEGKTPEMPAEAVRNLLDTLAAGDVATLRDRALVATLVYTAARVGAVVALRREDWAPSGQDTVLHFFEKGGKPRQIPVRADLARMLTTYLREAAIDDPRAPLFQSVTPNGGRVTGRPISANDGCRIVKRRLRQLGLPANLSAHSFRVATITNLLEQGIPLEQVQYLAGHADPRTTRLYDRRQERVTRQLVDTIAF
jgi:site-specific recombinase XerD